MKAAVIAGPDAAPVYTDFADPVAADGQHTVDLVAAGIHHVVRARAAGRHYSAAGSWPLVPGVDAVARTADGTLVYTGMVAQPWGTMAERFAVPIPFGIELPAGADPLAVAAGCNPGLASWGPLRARRDALAESGSGLGRVLILGATGMAGRLAVANAAALGADTVVAVGRNTEALAELAAQGDSVRTVALSGTADDAAAIASSLADGPPTTVLDFVWGPVAERTFTALAPIVGDAEVVHIQIGEGAGTTAAVPGALLRGCRYLLRGSGIGSVDPASLFASVAEFIEMIASGAVAIDYRSYPLSQVGTAWAATGPHRAVVVPG